MSGPLSQIVVLRTDHADRLSARLREQGVRATALGDRVRFGFHYFNNEDDVRTTLSILAERQPFRGRGRAARLMT
ncbi:hypothetical protein [Nonomuraea sp. NPDC050643]|uniref:hypothetical protein n=1 Tax=Nonomuraea sp. NPDC050643 TaxID=3155660 RepID=UPI0033D3FB4C